MNLNLFKQALTITGDEAIESLPVSTDLGVKNLSWILEEIGGKTFNHGLYRVLRADQITVAKHAMEAFFPEYCGRIVPFAFDWLGRYFACDLKRIKNGEPQVLMLEVGAGEAMEIPASVLDFHNVELVEYTNDALSVSFWHQWRSINPDDIAYTDCVGYKVPLFLGGSDTLPNLELIDLDVYVGICSQLRHKTRTLAPGQSINSVSIE